MDILFSNFFGNLLNMAFDALDSLLLSTLDNMLFVERMAEVSFAFNSGSITAIYQFLYFFSCTLVVLKFLFKGFQVYILWRDGDADSSPQDMFIGTLQAGVVMALFPTLYSLMASVTSDLAEGIMSRLGIANVQLTNILPQNASMLGLFIIILLIVYVIMLLVLYVKLIRRGFELLVLRLGVPIACLGLVDSDYGIWKGYMQTFFKTMFTTIIQLVLFSLSIRVITTPDIASILCGIAIISTAFATPTLMQQMLVSSGGRGGGLSSKVYLASNIARFLRH